MKKLTGLVIILAVLILGGYYGMGVLTEKTLKKDIQAINQSNGLFAELKSYNRGWFKSNAEIKWRLHVPERIVKDAEGKPQTVAAQDYQIETPIVIHHGPIIYADKGLHFGMGYAETDIDMPQTYTEQFEAAFSKDSVKPQLDLSIFVNYFNKSTVGFSFPRFKLIAKEGNGQFEWLGMDSTTSMSSELDKVDGELSIDGMHFNKDDMKVTLGKVSSDYDLHLTSTGLYLGDANLSLPSFDVTVKDQKIFAINDFRLTTSSDIEKNLFSTHLDVSLKSILANGQTYGPGDIEISLRNIDAEVLAKINEQATAMQNGTDAERQRAMLGLLPQLPGLFSKGAEFEISKLNMTLPQGVVDGHLLVTLPIGDSSNPFELIQKVQGNASLKIPKAVLQMLVQQSVMQQIANQSAIKSAEANQPASTPEELATTQIATMEQTGLIKAQDTDYLIEVSLEQGKFTVNGKPFDSSMVKF